jgi:U32 family peptidase
MVYKVDRSEATMVKPELVLPAGDLEKLKTALLFGGDAVYLGGRDFSLRAFAGNFDREDLIAGLKLARTMDKKVYVTVNVIAHNRDINNLPPYLEELAQLGVDGLIIADLGVMRLAQAYAPSIPVTISTQANICNYETAACYRDLGAARAVLARELTLDEIAFIKDRVNIELEIFIQGAMCVSYSGRCLLSHFMTGRSANQGACAHPCRYRYTVMEEKRPGQFFPIEEDERGSYIFNSRDLCLLAYVPELIEIGIDAFKVEGRMKSPLYVATTGKVYRQAIDSYALNREAFDQRDVDRWMAELQGIATRPFTNGFIKGEAANIQDIDKTTAVGRTEFCGIVTAYHLQTELLEIEQRANFGPGENLELLCPGGSILELHCEEMLDADGNKVDRARHPRQHIFIPWSIPIPEQSILRRWGGQN